MLSEDPGLILVLMLACIGAWLRAQSTPPLAADNGALPASDCLSGNNKFSKLMSPEISTEKGALVMLAPAEDGVSLEVWMPASGVVYEACSGFFARECAHQSVRTSIHSYTNAVWAATKATSYVAQIECLRGASACVPLASRIQPLNSMRCVTFGYLSDRTSATCT